MSNSHQTFVDALRLSNTERDALLQQLDREAGKFRGVDLRHNSRVPYQTEAGLVLRLTHPGGNVVDYLVRPRDISRNGIGFLHGNYLHADSHCQIVLRTKDGEQLVAKGRVRRCRHIRGRVHEVGTQFDKPIDLDLFVDSCIRTQMETEQSVELPHLAGRLLYVEDLADDQDLMEFHLSRLGVHVTIVSQGLEALQRVGVENYDLVITGVCLPGLSGLELAEAIRKKGLGVPIVALTADDSDETREEALARGCTSVMNKPYSFERLMELLKEHLPESSADTATGDCLLSEQWTNGQMRPLILKFVARLQEQVAAIGAAIAEQDLETGAMKQVQDIKGAAGSYGYPTVSEAAGKLHGLMKQNASQGDIQAKFDELAALAEAAGRVRAEMARAG